MLGVEDHEIAFITFIVQLPAGLLPWSRGGGSAHDGRGLLAVDGWPSWVKEAKTVAIAGEGGDGGRRRRA